MAHRMTALERRSGVPDNLTATDTFEANIAIDSSDSDKLKYNAVGTGYTVVTTAATQTLTNKNVVQPVATNAVDGALTITGGAVKLTKGSAGAYTLAAPTAAQEGTVMVIVAQSAFAHVVTATGLLDDGVTGGSKTTATFAAFVGSSLTLVALGLKWSVVSKNVVTIT